MDRKITKVRAHRPLTLRTHRGLNALHNHTALHRHVTACSTCIIDLLRPWRFTPMNQHLPAATIAGPSQLRGN